MLSTKMHFLINKTKSIRFYTYFYLKHKSSCPNEQINYNSYTLAWHTLRISVGLLSILLGIIILSVSLDPEVAEEEFCLVRQLKCCFDPFASDLPTQFL